MKTHNTFFAIQNDNFGIGNTKAEAKHNLKNKLCSHSTKLKTHYGYRCPECEHKFYNNK